MPDTSLQAQLDQIQKKKTLYQQRIKDARSNNRNDIVEIWLKEINILNKQHDALVSQQGNQQANKATQQTPSSQLSSAEKRRLRQLHSQIQYVEKKIKLHTERGEMGAVEKQTALLKSFNAEVAQLTSTKSTSADSNQSSYQEKRIGVIDSHIAYAEKMIAEYTKFQSPKAQQWIGKKFQLEAQREKLLQGSLPETPPPLPGTVAATPPTPAAAAPTAPKATPKPPPPVKQDFIATAHDINNQVRVIDLEIAHADKMIKEYQRYKSPKADQWQQRKNELIEQKSHIIKQAPESTASPTSGTVGKDLATIQRELVYAEKMIKEYTKHNSPKVDDWISKRNLLLSEKAQLESKSGGTVSASATLDREAMKAQVSRLNLKAKHADTQMRASLKRGDHPRAKLQLQQRNQYSQQVKDLMALLAATTAVVTPQQTADQTTPASTQTAATPNDTDEGAFEKSVAHKYVHTKRYTDEHAYIEIIEHLTNRSKYQHLAAAKETLYDITDASKLPPSGANISNPFIRDCFKIKISGITLEGYTINDTIFNTTFPKDFNEIVDQVNQHLAPAPELKHYKYLAHRDAIQLIPADRSISKYHSQFAGAKIKDLTIKDITIRSEGALQGLFASDGSFENIHMENISVETNSAHQIAILGLLSGTLDLSSPTGKPIHVNLLPLRLAGGNNIYINSFSSDSSYQYGKVSAGQSNAVIADSRQLMTKRGTYYKDFNMDAFFDAMQQRADDDSNVLTRIIESAKVAGTVV